MKKILVTLFASVLFFSFITTVSATTYPADCPAVAQSIVEAVGGCSAINCTQYANICSKCCPPASPVQPKTTKTTVDTPTTKTTTKTTTTTTIQQPEITTTAPAEQTTQTTTPATSGLLTKDALASAASISLTNFFNSPILIVVVVIIMILLIMWFAEKFISHKKKP